MSFVSMTDFIKREDSLRGYLRREKEKGLTFFQLAESVNVGEKVIRDFIEKDSKKKLTPKNYNKIVGSLTNLGINIFEQTFSSLVNELRGIHSEMITWDFESDYTEKQIQLFKKFRNFIENDAYIIANAEDEQNNNDETKSFLNIVNNEDLDAFDRADYISKFKQNYDNAYKDLRVYSAYPHDFLWQSNLKPLLIFLTTNNAHENQLILNSDNRRKLFNPMEKTKSSYAK